MLCAGQSATPPPSDPTVFSNPRAPSDDPRVGLKGGLYDAGEAAFGLQRIATSTEASGFAPGDTVGAPAPPMPPRTGQPPGPPPAQYGSTNSDLAFSGNHLFVGNYNGINFYDIDNPMKIKLRTSLICPGGQGDVSVYGHLLFMSAEAVNGRIDCGTQGIPLPPGYAPPPPPPAPANPDGTPGATAASAAASQPGPVPRRPHLRYQRPLESEAGRRRAELPRLAHAYAADRPQRQRQRLYLHLRNGRRSSGGRTGGVLGRRA